MATPSGGAFTSPLSHAISLPSFGSAAQVQAQAQQQQQSAAFSAVAAANVNNTSTTSSYFFTSPVSRRGSVASLLQSSAVEEEEEEEPPLSPASARSSSDERERQSPTASSISEFASPLQQHHHVSSRYTTPTRRQRSLSMGRRISVDVPPMERLAGRITMVVTPPRGDRDQMTTTTANSTTGGAGGATGLAQAGATATGGASSGAGATSGAPLNWPSVQPNISRMRFDLPPTKLHCQSPEQRACAAHHTNPLLVDAVAPSSTDVAGGHNSAVSTYPSPKCWCPFASDVYAVGVIVYEMSTGARWNAQSMEPLVAEYHNSKTAALAKQQQQQITAVIADGDTDELMCSSPTAHVRSVSPTPASKDADVISAAPPTTIPAGVDPLAWDLVCHCTAPESARIKSAELMHHAFFTRQAATATAAA